MIFFSRIKLPDFLKHPTLPILLLFLFLMTIVTTCSNNESFNEKELSVIASKQFNDPLHVSQIQPDTIKFVIDISESMRGFVRSGSFQKLFSKSITSLGPNTKIQYYKFDSILQKENDHYQFFNEATYNKRRAKFETLTSLMDSASHSIQILLTDFQFNDRRSYLETVGYFQKQIINGKYIKIFSAKPEFEGKIFPQFIRQKPYESNKPRPLYAMIIGEKKYSKFVESLLREVQIWENSITLSNGSPLQVKISDSNTDLKSNSSNLYLSSKDSLSFKCRIICPAFLEWGNWTSDVIDAQIYNFKDSTFIIEENPSLKIREVIKTTDTCMIKFYKNEIIPSTPKLLRIQFKPREILDWVEEQSCDEYGNQSIKTVKFYDFIIDVIKNVSNPFSIATVHVFVLKD